MHNNQRGGIVSFIVVGLVLAGLLAGALYYSKQQGREARNGGSPQVTQEDKNTETPASGTDEKENEETAGSNTQGQSANGGEGSTTQPQPQPSTTDRESQTPSTGSTDRVASTGPSDIPETGPTEITAVVIGLGTLTFAGYTFASTRRNLRASAMRK